MSFCY